MCRHTSQHVFGTAARQRRGVAIVFFSVMLLLIAAMMAFALDLGHVMLTRTQLQVAADSAAMAAATRLGRSYDDVFQSAQHLAGKHLAASQLVKLDGGDVELGMWDIKERRFTPTGTAPGNAVRVTARRDANHGGDIPLFFARALNKKTYTMSSSAVAMASPRDIAFVVDLSGSMNNDTEPCWATDAINSEFAGGGYPTIGNQLMTAVYQDFGFGVYPGTLQYLGVPWSVGENNSAYANLTADNGPLTKSSIPSKYRIAKKDSEATRKQKAYSIIIDQQIAAVMPAAKPTPSSATNYAYWEKYLDYIVESKSVSKRGTLPPSQDSDRITSFGNPDTSTFPQVSGSVPAGFRNKIGYRTYVQFMMDYGRDQCPTGSIRVPLSADSPDCPWHDESTAGGTFRFPPREQPVHASRRALIAAIEVVRERNEAIEDPDQRDWVSIVTFDRLTGGGPIVRQPLTGDYEQAMRACTRLQAVSDNSASTATETGMLAARDHIRSEDEGGLGRRGTNKVVVLLTDGVPNLVTSSSSTINSYISSHPSSDFYSSSKLTYNAPLVASAKMQIGGWSMFPVGIGLGTDYEFMDRLARFGGTANEDGNSPRGSGNPAEYEEQLAEIFREIITNPQVRLVQ